MQNQTGTKVFGYSPRPRFRTLLNISSRELSQTAGRGRCGCLSLSLANRRSGHRRPTGPAFVQTTRAMKAAGATLFRRRLQCGSPYLFKVAASDCVCKGLGAIAALSEPASATSRRGATGGLSPLHLLRSFDPPRRGRPGPLVSRPGSSFEWPSERVQYFENAMNAGYFAHH